MTILQNIKPGEMQISNVDGLGLEKHFIRTNGKIAQSPQAGECEKKSMSEVD